MTHPTRSTVAERLAQYHWQPFLESLDAGFHGIPIDVRLPYLDLRLIHYALVLPPMPWLQSKRLLREVARGLIPDAVRSAPKRGVPGLLRGAHCVRWAREPAPFVPSAALSRFVDVSKLLGGGPCDERERPAGALRLRALDRWLREFPSQPLVEGADCASGRVRALSLRTPRSSPRRDAKIEHPAWTRC